MDKSDVIFNITPPCLVFDIVSPKIFEHNIDPIKPTFKCLVHSFKLNFSNRPLFVILWFFWNFTQSQSKFLAVKIIYSNISFFAQLIFLLQAFFFAELPEQQVFFLLYLQALLILFLQLMLIGRFQKETCLM